MKITRAIRLTIALLAILAGILLIVLPVSPYDHYWYSGYVLIDTPQQLEQFQSEYLLRVNTDRASTSEQTISRFQSDGSTVYWIALDTWGKLDFDGCKTNLKIQEIHEDHWWVRVLASALIVFGVIILIVIWVNIPAKTPTQNTGETTKRAIKPVGHKDDCMCQDCIDSRWDK